MSCAFSQTLWEDNFESYTVGNFTDQGGWVRDGGEDDWVKIAKISPAKGKSLQLNTNEENDSGIFVTHENNWENRNAGNNIFVAEFDYYTGDQLDSLGIVVLGTSDFDIIAEIGWDIETEILYLSGAEMFGTLLENPTPNTWYHITTTFNTNTGEIKARVNNEPIVSGFADVELLPEIFDYSSIMGSTIAIDNVVVSAKSTDVLTTGEHSATSKSTRIYPNPVRDNIKISTKKNIAESRIIDFSGKTLLSFGNQKSFNVQSLTPGTYILTIKYDDNSQETLKLIKKQSYHN